MGAHGGSGGLAVGAGHTQCVLIAAHDGPPGLRPLKDRDPGGTGGGDLRVIIVDGGSADDAARPPDALPTVSDDHRDPQRPQMGHRGALMEVGAADDHSRIVEHLSQWGHGHTADPHQMGVGAGSDIRMNVGLHTDTPRSKNRPVGLRASGFPDVPRPRSGGAGAGEQAGFSLHLTQSLGSSTGFPAVSSEYPAPPEGRDILAAVSGHSRCTSPARPGSGARSAPLPS